MTTPGTDTWLNRAHTDLDLIRAAILDLIDGHPQPQLPTPRRPSRRETDTTWRPGDDYQPTLKAPSRRHNTSDPVGHAILAWERTVQHATTDLHTIASELATTVDVLALTPIDDQGGALTPPPTPPLRHTPSGRTVIDTAPTTCRTTVITTTTWIGAAIDALADRSRRATGDTATAIDRHVDQTLALLHTVKIRHAQDRIRMCKAGCGAPAPPHGKGATCQRCRKRRSRT